MDDFMDEFEAFEDADCEDDSLPYFDADEYENDATDFGAPVSFVSEWQAYMDENEENF